MTIEDLCLSLHYSVRSVQRLLKAVGYFSSITHNGKWYTLKDIPIFDNNGLWFYQGIGFSQKCDLIATIRHLIDNSTKGLMANDLSKILCTTCPPVLNKLYKAKMINRVKTSKGFVYLSIDRTVNKQQFSYIENTYFPQRPSETDTISILVEFIRNPNRTFEELSSHLKQKNLYYCANTIENMFISLGLEKKIQK